MNPEEEKKRILVVEDDPELSELLSTLLTNQGFDVQTCMHGDDALDYAQKNSFNLIILDIMLPGKNGYEICRALKEQPSSGQPPIIFLSALAQKSEIDKGLAAGATLYIKKPYENAYLLEQIHKLLERP
ncbi:MAG: response regulator [Elusimicrobia bacterium]|nr:response regulator [Elusimicrobiota bacterium]MBD3412278.1 response regulator [Elusimicrobiota bacterium]